MIESEPICQNEELAAQSGVDSTAKMVEDPVSCPGPTLGLPLAITASPRPPSSKPSTVSSFF